ncbi:hypothetical protein PEC301296_11760 [Pectobacterium carotovorum subsp. carotovorum]|nr:hypothetical protein PEC301296_11760 [Pectobacterium carotovorum subsp. carotovorum]
MPENPFPNMIFLSVLDMHYFDHQFTRTNSILQLYQSVTADGQVS